MKAKAVRLYGKRDLRLEEIELPEPREDEILVKLITDSLCVSTYKASEQGAEHKKVPKDVDKNPVIVGHECCGEILQVGEKWRNSFKPGDRVVMQPAVRDPENLYAVIGYSFKYLGGDATHVIVPNVVIERGCLLKYEGESFFSGSLSEPICCIIAGFHANYHNNFMLSGEYKPEAGIRKGGNMAILAGAGPMGLGAIDYALHSELRPSVLLVTDIDQKRLERAESIYTPQHASEMGVKLVYLNTSEIGYNAEAIKKAAGVNGFDDVFVYAPVEELISLGDRLLREDGCLNFFSGPTDSGFSAPINFYNVHYLGTHVAGNSGGTLGDLYEALRLMEKGVVNPAPMITHIGGLDAAAEATINLPRIPGGKKLIYNQLSMPLTEISQFRELGKTDPLFATLADITEANGGVWSKEAEDYLMSHMKNIFDD